MSPGTWTIAEKSIRPSTAHIMLIAPRGAAVDHGAAPHSARGSAAIAGIAWQLGFEPRVMDVVGPGHLETLTVRTEPERQRLTKRKTHGTRRPQASGNAETVLTWTPRSAGLSKSRLEKGLAQFRGHSVRSIGAPGQSAISRFKGLIGNLPRLRIVFIWTTRI